MLGGSMMLEKAHGSQLMQVPVALGMSREVGEARRGANWM
jgi:hypothetical protein